MLVIGSDSSSKKLVGFILDRYEVRSIQLFKVSLLLVNVDFSTSRSVDRARVNSSRFSDSCEVRVGCFSFWSTDDKTERRMLYLVQGEVPHIGIPFCSL